MTTAARNDEVVSNVSLEEETSAAAPATAAAAATTTTATTNNQAHQARAACYIIETSAVQFQKGCDSWSRVKCPSCNASRYLYCPDCCEILIPKNDWPKCIRHGTLHLPFPELHIILDDRRICASGVQVATILRATAAINAAATMTAAAADAAMRGGEGGNEVVPLSGGSYRLFDQALDEGIPDYKQEGQDEGTYLLFPDHTSVPLSSVVTPTASAADADADSSYCPLKTLVVLDCKWTNSSMRLHPNLACLRKVHLDNPPESSYFWRWHSAGKGMLSTVEAIYYAAAQVAEQLQWNTHDQEQLVHLLWLFGLQRQVICHRFENNKDKSSSASSTSSSSRHDTTQQSTSSISNTTPISCSSKIHEKNQHLPFTENAKEIARALRKLQKHRKKDKNS